MGMNAGNGDPHPDIRLLKDSTLDLPTEELRKRYNEGGYLWVSMISRITDKPMDPFLADFPTR